ncbi:hypothetical protein CASFOL_029187 [Castilleja foliolosa]|uniref:Uncharacterized protein n=1 Tax=Castilleja foliolosa TaxID=1961234 RepID=A0ABD3CC96_9LAMI
MSYNNYLISILIITSYLLNQIAFSRKNDTELGFICLSSNKTFTNSYNKSREVGFVR